MEDEEDIFVGDMVTCVVRVVRENELKEGVTAKQVLAGEMPEEEEKEAKEGKVINNPVLLATLDDVVSAEILKDLLTEAGILYSSDSDADGTMKVTFGGSFVAEDIYVDEQDLDAANTVYDEFLNSEQQFDEEFFEDAENENE